MDTSSMTIIKSAILVLPSLLVLSREGAFSTGVSVEENKGSIRVIDFVFINVRVAQRNCSGTKFYKRETNDGDHVVSIEDLY